MKAPERQSTRQLAALHEVSHANKRLYRAFLLKEELRLLYHLEDTATVEAHLTAWLAWAASFAVHQARAHHPPLPRRHPRRHPPRPCPNARVEAINTQIRLLTRRAFGFHGGPEPLIALIYLCCTRLTPRLPLR